MALPQKSELLSCAWFVDFWKTSPLGMEHGGLEGAEMFPGIEPMSMFLLRLSLVRFEREEKSSSSRVPLRLQFVKFISMMLPAELQVMPNQWQWLVELLRLHELRHSGLNKLDFQRIRAFASVNALHFNADDDKSIESRKRRISNLLCFIFVES